MRKSCPPNHYPSSRQSSFPIDDEKQVAQTTFSISQDAVAAPIFFREVPLPVLDTLNKIHEIRWLVGDTSKDGPPHTVLENMKTCPVHLDGYLRKERAVNIPEFVKKQSEL